ncbi:thiamine pyrophosphate-dependent enzyme [Chitinophaga sedimenti]|uniref:thiamine pyrophosphate-dependent enzyme n=1 Tax=Chitinophaga sedimenti TaxID=2033606 RepID=UPI002006BDBA|nr:thiamine pyrophosphate-dependent enzyme [Chitinophaga sedimenti]MCK7559780.1 thiamine pyrophosphate-dependent enzyme [Chitinophaga sedimenti]
MKAADRRHDRENALLLEAYRLMCLSMAMTDKYEANRQLCKYVHSTSRGHEAVQLATGLLLKSCDYVSPYYRDDSMMLAMGFTPYELMLQLLAKRTILSVAAVRITAILRAAVLTGPLFPIKAVLQACR